MLKAGIKSRIQKGCKMSKDYSEFGYNAFGYKDPIGLTEQNPYFSSLDTDAMFGDSSIGGLALSAGAVSTSKIADDAVDGDKIADGAVSSVTATIAMRGWTFTSTFSATDYRVVAWSAGTFTSSDGTAYSITGGNTGNMAALTYIYLDTDVSTTLLQVTTTAANAVGDNKVLLAVAQNNSDTTSDATFQVFGGSGGNTIMVDNIVANSASTNEFITNTAQIANAVITYAKITSVNADTITTGSLAGINMSIGTGNSIFKADSNGIYLGNATFASAPFRVNMSGAVNASNLTITGGTININDNFTVDASGSVVANMYSFNSGNIINHASGMIFKNTYGINYYNSANDTMIAQLKVDGSNELILANTTGKTSITAGNVEGFEMATTGWVTMGYGASISGGLNIPTGNITMNTGSLSSSTSNINIASGKNLVFLGTQGSINCGTIDCDAIAMNTNHLTGVNNISCKSISLNNGQNEGSIQNLDTLLGYNDLRLKVPSGGVSSTNRIMFVDSSNNETASIRPNDTGKFFSNNSYINLNGTDKLAIVPVGDEFKALYCAESPEVWFFDFCKSKDKIDPLFLKVTEGEMRFIKVDGGGYQVWRRRKGYGQKRFESKTAEQFRANEKFLSIPKKYD